MALSAGRHRPRSVGDRRLRAARAERRLSRATGQFVVRTELSAIAIDSKNVGKSDATGEILVCGGF